MIHEFLLLDSDTFDYHDYMKIFNSPLREKESHCVKLHHDFLLYIYDSISWIILFNPSKKETCKGLCLYGPTVLKTDSAHIAENIFSTWSNLFKNGPDKLELTGSYTWGSEDSPEGGEYEKLVFDRDELTQSLDKLADYCHTVKEGKGKYYVLHLGI